MNEIKKLYIGKFIYGFGCMASYTFILFFLKSGLTQIQIASLFSIFFIANMILEIPTGGFADLYGHKASFALGLIIESFYYLIFVLFPTYNGFVVGMIVAALGLCFQSGANDSLTYEIMNKLNKKDEYLKTSGRISAMMSMAVIIAAPIGTMIYKYSPNTPYFISFVLVLISGLVVSLVKYNHINTDYSRDNYFNQIKTGIVLVLKNTKLKALFLIGFVGLMSSYVFGENIGTPLQLRIGIDIGLFGVIQSLIAVGYLLVNYFSYKLASKIGDINTIILSLGITFISLITLSRINYYYGVGFIVVFFMSHGLRINILDNLQQKEATSSERSTIASAGSMLKSLGTAMVLPLWGLMLDRSGINTTLIILSCAVLFIGLLGVSIYKYRYVKI